MPDGCSRWVLLIRGSGYLGVEVVDSAVGVVFGASAADVGAVEFGTWSGCRRWRGR